MANYSVIKDLEKGQIVIQGGKWNPDKNEISKVKLVWRLPKQSIILVQNITISRLTDGWRVSSEHLSSEYKKLITEFVALNNGLPYLI